MSDAGLKLIETAFGLQVIYNGRRLYGERPLPDVERRLDSIHLQEDTLYILPSPVVCHGVEALVRRLPASSALLALEADPLLLELSRRFWTDIDTDLAYLSSTTPADIELGTGKWGLGRFRRVREIGLTGGSGPHRDTYRQIHQRLDRDIRIAWQNRLTLAAMGRLWMRNIFRNIPTAHSYARARGIQDSDIGSGPVVVCGAGPSLNTAIRWIVQMREHIQLIAADTALPALVGAGIDPDGVVALEGQLANLGDFLPVQGGEYTLYADLTSAPAVIELHHPGQVAWMLTSFAPLSVVRRLANVGLPMIELPPLGSVGVAAVVVASRITSGPIFLTGLDMSILPGETHARGTAPHRALLTATSRMRGLGSVAVGAPLISSESAEGGRVDTTVAMLGYGEELRRIVRELDRVYALSASGLPTGAPAVSLEEAEQIVCNDEGASEYDNRDQPELVGGAPNLEVRRFLEEEIANLSSFRRHLEEHLSETADRSEELRREIAALDYVAVDFPDPPSRSELETSYLRRAFVAAGYYEHRIGVSIDALTE